MAAAVAGCAADAPARLRPGVLGEAPPPPAPPAHDPTTGEPSRPVELTSEADLRSAAPTDLARRAEQDVALMLAGGLEPGDTPEDSPSPRPAAARAGPAAASGPPEILWNAPLASRRPQAGSGGKVGERSPETPEAARADGGTAAPPTILGRPEGAAAHLAEPLPEADPADPPLAGLDAGSPSEPTDGPATDTPSGEAVRSDRIGELIVELSRELYRESTYADMPLRELFVIAAHGIVRPARALSADAIPGLSPREREVLEQFQAFCQGLGAQLDGTREAEVVVTEAVDRLRNGLVERPLEIVDLALCYRVNGFGDFDAFDRASFLAHSEQQVIVYLEIDGFTSERNGRGDWATELSQQLVIYADHDGIPVWTADWQPAVDVSRNRRKDFFTVQVITLPAALSVGRYRLKIRIRDEKSRSETERNLAFEMVADAKLAARMSAGN